VVPLGWQTEIDFRNHDGMLPHSAEIIKPSTLPVQSVAPAISRAPASPEGFNTMTLRKPGRASSET